MRYESQQLPTPPPIYLAAEAVDVLGYHLDDLKDQRLFPGVTAQLAGYGPDEEDYTNAGTHLIPEDITPIPADPARIYTTVQPGFPGKNATAYVNFHEKAKTGRALNYMATNKERRAANVAGLQEVKHNPTKTAIRTINAYRSITAVEFPDVHFDHIRKKGGKIVDGTTVFGAIKFTFPDRYNAQIVAGTLRKWLENSKNDDARVVHDIEEVPETGEWTVTVENSTEYDWRGDIENSVGSRFAQVLFDVTGTVLPDVKRSLPDHEQHGETFHPWARDQALGVRRDYHRLAGNLRVTYTGEYAQNMGDESDPHTAQTAVGGLIDAADPDPLINTPAAIFEIIRKVSNGMSHRIRGRANKDYPQNKDDLNVTQKYTDLRRRPSRNLELGPGDTHVANLGQVTMNMVTDTGKEWRTALKEHASFFIAKTLGKIILSGPMLMAEAILVPLDKRTPKELREQGLKDFRAWRQQQAAAMVANRHLRAALAVALQQLPPSHEIRHTTPHTARATHRLPIIKRVQDDA
jgi:hypothetical protein